MLRVMMVMMMIMMIRMKLRGRMTLDIAKKNRMMTSASIMMLEMMRGCDRDVDAGANLKLP